MINRNNLTGLIAGHIIDCENKNVCVYFQTHTFYHFILIFNYIRLAVNEIFVFKSFEIGQISLALVAVA